MFFQECGNHLIESLRGLSLNPVTAALKDPQFRCRDEGGRSYGMCSRYQLVIRTVHNESGRGYPCKVAVREAVVEKAPELRTWVRRPLDFRLLMELAHYFFSDQLFVIEE